ncbi:serine protease [Archangium sp.]|jgi:hypothetical protein|uniref:serine protease n=1 Tax=Archangium sp. TaxID=1872627 RepID=UPI002EDACB63
MDETLYRATARVEILQDGSRVDWGTGFLVGPRHLLTAFHVVKPCVPGPDALRIRLIFRYLGNHETEATLEGGAWDAEEDWALLECVHPPSGVIPLALGTAESAGGPFKTFGFAKGANSQDGDVFSGEIENPRAEYGKVQALQLYSRQVAAGLGTNIQGLSGGPILAEGVVVGIVRSFLMNKDKGAVAGTIYACPTAPVIQSAVAGPLVRTDVCVGLPPLPTNLSLPPEPFRYLNFYTREDARLFFGRCREIETLCRMVTEPDRLPLILLYGQSGVGKSSLLQAGLFPRLEADWDVRYRRRSQELGLLGGLAAELGCGSLEPQAIEEAWRARENSQGVKPLLILLDQVEEIFTRPRPTSGAPTDAAKEELNALVGVLHRHYVGLAEPPRSRLILSFRKDWQSEIEAAIKTWSMNAGAVFIPPVDRAAVKEIMLGLERDKRLRDRYQLTIEPELVPLLVDDLTRDRESPVAPSLQVLLTNLWKQAVAKSRASPAFTRQLYEPMRTSLGLEAFLDQQLAALPERARQLGGKGLTLDLLAFHTTTAGVAERRTEADRRSEYGDKAEAAEYLAQELKRVYLLVDPPEDSTEGAKATRLVHDTLGPIVRKRFAESGLPGQRARRVLENRAVDWRDKAQGPLLDEHDVALAEQGTAGMRALAPHERLCLEASQKRRQHNQKVRWFIRTVFALAGVFICGLAFWVWRSNTELEKQMRQTARSQAVALLEMAEEQLAADKKPLDVLPYVDRAVTLAPEDDERLPLYLNKAVQMALSAPVLVGALSDTGSSQGGRLGRDGRQALSVENSGEMEALRFEFSSPKAGLQGVTRRHLKTSSGSQVNSATARLSPDGRWAVGVEHEFNDLWKVGRGEPSSSARTLVIWNLESGERALSKPTSGSVDLEWGSDSKSLWQVEHHRAEVIALFDGVHWMEKAHAWTSASNTLFIPVVSSVARAPIDQVLLAEELQQDGMAACGFKLGDPLSGDARPITSVQEGCQRVLSAAISRNENFLALLLIEPDTFPLAGTWASPNDNDEEEPLRETKLELRVIDRQGDQHWSEVRSINRLPASGVLLSLDDDGQRAIFTVNQTAVQGVFGLPLLWKKGEKIRQTTEADGFPGTKAMAERHALGEAFLLREAVLNKATVVDATIPTDRSWLMVQQRGGSLTVWPRSALRTAEENFVAKPEIEGFITGGFSWDGKYLVGNTDKSLIVWTVEPHKISSFPSRHAASEQAVVRSTRSPSRRWAALVTMEESPPRFVAEVFNLETQKWEYTTSRDGSFHAFRLNDDGGLTVLDGDSRWYRFNPKESWMASLGEPLASGLELAAPGKMLMLVSGMTREIFQFSDGPQEDTLMPLAEQLLQEAHSIELGTNHVQLGHGSHLKFTLVSSGGASKLTVGEGDLQITPPRREDLPRGQWVFSEDGRLFAEVTSKEIRLWFHDGTGLGKLQPRSNIVDAYFHEDKGTIYLRTASESGEIRDHFVFERFKSKPAWAGQISKAVMGQIASENGLTLESDASLLSGPGREAFFKALREDSSQAARLLRRYYGLPE